MAEQLKLGMAFKTKNKGTPCYIVGFVLGGDPLLRFDEGDEYNLSFQSLPLSCLVRAPEKDICEYFPQNENEGMTYSTYGRREKLESKPSAPAEDKQRYSLEIGRWGMYVQDNEKSCAIDMNEVLKLLNNFDDVLMGALAASIAHLEKYKMVDRSIPGGMLFRPPAVHQEITDQKEKINFLLGMALSIFKQYGDFEHQSMGIGEDASEFLQIIGLGEDDGYSFKPNKKAEKLMDYFESAAFDISKFPKDVA